MSTSTESLSVVLQKFFSSWEQLRQMGILTSKKDFTCQIGEWLVETLYGGKRASSSIQKAWDVDVKGKRIQVKTHAKAASNAARFTLVDCTSMENVDELVIMVFSFNYKLRAFYKLP